MDLVIFKYFITTKKLGYQICCNKALKVHLGNLRPRIKNYFFKV